MSTRCRSALSVPPSPRLRRAGERSASGARRTTQNARRTTVLLAALGAAGCAAAGLPPIEAEPALAALRGTVPRLTVRVAVAPPRLQPAPPGEHAGDCAWSAEAAQQAAVEALQAAGLAATPLAAGPEAEADAAWAAGLDLLLENRVTRLETRFVGANGWYWPSALLWSALIFPAWFIPVEDYEVRLATETRLVAVASGQVLWRHTVEASERRSLDGFARGLVLLGLLRVPSALGPENWRAVADRLRPGAVRAWQRALAEAAVPALRDAVRTRRFADATRQTLAVAVGCGRYFDRGLDDRKLPPDDAEAFAAWLGRAGVPARQRRLLTDQDATRAAVLAAVRELLAARARPGDRCCFYFAGYAAPDGAGGVALLPYDAAPADPGATGLPLRVLAEAFAAIPDAELLVVIDAGRGGDQRGRFADCGRPAPDPARVAADLAALTARPRTAVVWGCADGEPALAAGGRARGGLATWSFVRAAEQAQDRDGDGRLALAEALGAFRQGVHMHAVFNGAVQDPRAYGAVGADGVSLPPANRRRPGTAP